MSFIKNEYDTILNCVLCNGKGISDEWISSDGDFDFEWCDCNPNHLVVEEMF